MIESAELKYNLQQFKRNENHIEYKIRARDNSRRNPFDQAGLGSLGNNRLLVTYSFYVDKKDAEWAVRLIHSQV